MRQCAPTRSRRGAGDDGETLIELLVTITIMGVAIVAVLSGIGAAIRLSAAHRNSANADVALTIAAEAVKSAAPSTCSGLTVAFYGPALTAITSATLPSGWTTSNLTIAAATCDSTASLNLQTITVRATPPNSAATESVDVVKRSL